MLSSNTALLVKAAIYNWVMRSDLEADSEAASHINILFSKVYAYVCYKMQIQLMTIVVRGII